MVMTLLHACLGVLVGIYSSLLVTWTVIVAAGDEQEIGRVMAGWRFVGSDGRSDGDGPMEANIAGASCPGGYPAYSRSSNTRAGINPGLRPSLPTRFL